MDHGVRRDQRLLIRMKTLDTYTFKALLEAKRSGLLCSLRETR
jgi:hypothetical protein